MMGTALRNKRKYFNMKIRKTFLQKQNGDCFCQKVFLNL